MMKNIFLLFLFLSAPLIYAREILHYRYGNQITRSELSVQEDGSVVVIETTCCPPHSESTQFFLSENQFYGLEAAIENSSTTPLQVLEGEATTEGSSSGELIAWTEAGKKVIVRTIERSSSLFGKDILTINPSPQSRWVEDFVFDQVVQKMYRRFFIFSLP